MISNIQSSAPYDLTRCCQYQCCFSKSLCAKTSLLYLQTQLPLVLGKGPHLSRYWGSGYCSSPRFDMNLQHQGHVLLKTSVSISHESAYQKRERGRERERLYPVYSFLYRKYTNTLRNIYHSVCVCITSSRLVQSKLGVFQRTRGRLATPLNQDTRRVP
jgi:hypothetical protein